MNLFTELQEKSNSNGFDYSCAFLYFLTHCDCNFLKLAMVRQQATNGVQLTPDYLTCINGFYITQTIR